MLRIEGAEIRKVSIIDDEPSVRAAYEAPVEEINAEPVPEEGPLGELRECVTGIAKKAQAAICDYQLTVKTYARFNGAQLAAELYKNHLPTILCTKYDKAQMRALRKYRRYIPVLINPKELSPAVVVDGFRESIEEFKGHFGQGRKTWRALVRIEDTGVDGPNSFVSVVVPAWNSAEVISLQMDDLPPEIQKVAKPGVRLHAAINIGAETNDSVYFDHWEPN